MDKVLLNLLTGTASTGVSITKGEDSDFDFNRDRHSPIGNYF